MALSRIPGNDELYVGGIFALRKPSVLKDKNITTILSVIQYSFVRWEDFDYRFTHLSIDIDDVEDADIVVHMPKMVYFIERGLRGDAALRDGMPGRTTSIGRTGTGAGRPSAEGDEITPAPSVTSQAPTGQLADLSLSQTSPPGRPGSSPGPGAVFVHCAMGKSRSVTAIIAFLLWKYPHRYGASAASNPDRAGSARETVLSALRWVQQARPIAEPNPGFMAQLELWWMMGCPAEADDAVERHPAYQRWLYQRELEESRAARRAPGWVIFGDEEDGERGAGAAEKSRARDGPGSTEVRCKLCRRVLATQGFVVPHRSDPPAASGQSEQQPPQPPCPHVFIEPLSWMRPALETEALEGRLVCPNARCGATVGRFAWQGFKCTCGEWVCPAFSLNRAKVDEVTARPGSRGDRRGADPRTAVPGLRMPPGAAGFGRGDGGGQKENL